MADSNYTVLARKWRPQSFDDVVGQEHITRTLKNAIASGRIHHAFLFLGSRGIGKTTTARILAKALNCQQSDTPTVSPCGVCDNCVSIAQGNNIDVIEIDGASNNTVDNVRDIRDNVRMVPSSGRYKVYIIDEVHQLSTSAFNALLKTLEEPPAHAVFILATTEAHKIPATIVSRCQRYDFRRVPMAGIAELLRKILAKEGRAATDEALFAIARAAEGGVRDSEGILDELMTYCDGEITFKDVFDVLGLVDWRVMHTLCDALLAGDVARQMTVVEDVITAGKDLSQFVEELLRYFRNLLVCKSSKDTEILRLPEDETAELARRAARFPMVKLLNIVEQFAALTNGFDSQIAQRTALEALLIRLSRVDTDVSLDTVMEKLLLLGAGGVVPAVAAPPAEGGAPPNPPEVGPAQTPRPVPTTGFLGGVEAAPVSPPAPAPRPVPAAAPAEAAGPAPQPVVDREALKARLIAENPGLGAVFDVFRGKVAEVRPAHGEPAAEEPGGAEYLRGVPADVPPDESEDAADAELD